MLLNDWATWLQPVLCCNLPVSNSSKFDIQNSCVRCITSVSVHDGVVYIQLVVHRLWAWLLFLKWDLLIWWFGPHWWPQVYLQFGAVIVVWWLVCSTVDRQVKSSNLPCAGALCLSPSGPWLVKWRSWYVQPCLCDWPYERSRDTYRRE